MFKPDQPITSAKEDLLGRGSFARSLGDAILAHEGIDSLVIGLFGAWGSGKTSIVNMALEHIEQVSQDTEAKPIIVNFNPWNYSDQNQLVAQFFAQLSARLRKPGYGASVKEAGRKLLEYASFFEPAVSVLASIAATPIVGFGLKLFGGVGKALSSRRQKDLKEVRADINKLLAGQPHKIIVVIDDIDRLNNTEIRQMFQLVKSLGDFPKTMYLLAFDRNVVIDALVEVQKGSGEEYLEKVVQVPFDVPPIPKDELERLLLSQLTELLQDVPEDRFDQTYWGNVYLSGLTHLFETIRDVTRFINALRFGFDMVKDEVNPVDFIAITALQVFVPEVYYGIRDNKGIFAGPADASVDAFPYGRYKKDQAKKICDELLENNGNVSPDVLISCLKFIFPKLQGLYGNTYYTYHYSQSWRKARRICSPELFDIYFRLAIPKEQISQTEVEAVLTLAANQELLAEALLGFNKNGRIKELLRRLQDFTESDIPEEHIENIITVLMDLGDLFVEASPPGLFELGTETLILRLTYQLLHRLDDRNQRLAILRKAGEEASKSLYTLIHQVSVQGHSHGKDDSEPLEPEERRTLNSDQLEELELLARGRIESWAVDGRLKKHPKLPYILSRWKRWGGEDQVKDFIATMLEDDEEVIDFITCFAWQGQRQSMGDYVAERRWQINLQWMESFVDLQELQPRIEAIVASANYEQLIEEKRRAAQLFVDNIDEYLDSRTQQNGQE